MTEQHGEKKGTKEGGKEQKADEGPWLKLGVILSLGTLVLTYLLLALAIKWPPFSPHPGPVKPRPIPVTSSPPPPVGSIGATFLATTPADSNSNGDNSYYVRVELYGLKGATCTISWQTVNNSSGLYAGTSGKLTTGTLRYSDDIWHHSIEVTIPQIAYQGLAWHTVFTVYSPNGVEIASSG